MHAAHYSSLLPEVFRHKTTRVRVPQPKAILLDFHGTISERRWEDKVIFPYVKQAVSGYLKDNWDHEVIQKCLPGLRNESFEQRFRNKFEDAPVISDGVDSEDDHELSEIMRQVGDFVVWQMNSKKETRETQTIERLVWQDGLRQKRISTPIFDDVLPCIRDWHIQYKCAIYIISSLEQDTLRLLFENTNKGNLDQYVRDYISTKSGDKLVSDVYKKYYENLNLNDRVNSPKDEVHHHQDRLISHLSSSSPIRHISSSLSLLRRSPESLISKQDSSTGSRSHKSDRSSFERILKPILFLTDSGQEAKAACQVSEGRAFECILVNRPGNRKIRTFYLSQFPYIERFDDIEFVK